MAITPGTTYTQWWPHDVGDAINPKQPVAAIAVTCSPARWARRTAATAITRTPHATVNHNVFCTGCGKPSRAKNPSTVWFEKYADPLIALAPLLDPNQNWTEPCHDTANPTAVAANPVTAVVPAAR